MTFEEMKAKADSFFEFPTENRDHVTTTSAVLFALEAYKRGVNAANTLPHRVMFDAGIATAEKRIIELESAITKTLNENGHLADGDVCTLMDLKHAMPNWELD